MTRTAFIRRGVGDYPQGVPNPYIMHRHPFPTRFHGGIWTRPVFGFPLMPRTTSVMVPGYDITNGTAGLGRVPVRRAMAGWNVGQGIFKPGGYGGGVFDGNISGLGSEATDYPWKAYSAKTVELQQTTNQALRQAGYCPIAEDGKLGPATCGARAQLSLDYAGRTLFALPSTCPGDGTPYTWPKKVGAGCPGTSQPTVSIPTTSPTTTASMSMPMSSSTKKALAIMGGALITAVAVVYFKKRSGTAAK